MRIIFCGTPAFAVPTLETLLALPHELVAVYTQPDRPAGRGRKLLPGPVKQLAEANGILPRQPKSLKPIEEQEKLAALEPDLLVVVAYGLILPPKVLAIPKLGAVNIHASLLPRWRGAAPIQRALLAGDRETGITLMQMAEGLDTGPILHQVHYRIQAEDTSASLFETLARLGADTLAETLPKLAAGALTPVAQDDEQATYAHKLTADEALLDWQLPATKLALQARGYNPWPVARTIYQNAPLKIWQAKAIAVDTGLPPGTVTMQGKDWLVATGSGSLQLLAVQRPGGKRMPVAAFANAHALDGVRLG